MTPNVPRAQQAALTTRAILDAARRRFTASGYEGTTIRAVAADASVDPALVMRYFGNKKSLFEAAVEIDLEMSDFAQVPRAELGVAIARHFLSRWETDATGVPLRVLLTAASTDTAAAEKMASVFESQLKPVIEQGDFPTGVTPGRRAAVIASQVLGFALCRYVLKLPAIASMDGDAVTAWLGPTIQRYLDTPEPPTPAPPG